MRKSIILYLFAGLSIVCLAVGRLLLGTWMPFMSILVGLVVIFIAGGFWLDRATLKEFFGMKTTKHGLNMGSVILIFFIFLVAINFLAARKYKTFDFSMAKINTLSDQSLKMVESLTEDLKVIYFYKAGTEGVEETKKAFTDLLKKYQDQSSKVKLEFVEMNERPDIAKQYEIDAGTGVVLVEYKGRKNKLEKIDEQELTNAIVKVSREKDKIIYFTVGHGESDLAEGKEGTGAALVKNLLEGNRYLVKTLNFNEVPSVPQDADVVMIMGPKQSFLDREEKALTDYMKNGGNLVVALESRTPHALNIFLQKLGLRLKDNYVLQVMKTPFGDVVDPQVTPATVFSETSAITKPFGKGQFVRLRLPSAIEKVGAPEGFQYDELLKVGDNGVGFTDLTFSKNQEKGPFTLAYTVKGKMDNSDKEFQAIVFGDSEFMSNQLLYQNLNRDLVLNTAAFLAKEENLISITPKEVGNTEMFLTPTKYYIFLFGFVIPLPILLLVTSGVFWYRRRYA